MTSTHPLPQAQRTLPRWVLLSLAGFGAVLLVGAALGWILRGSAILIDMADFFCL